MFCVFLAIRTVPGVTQPLIDIVGAFPTLPAQLLDEHADDGTGHCTSCPVDGSAAARPWPCALHDLAVAAQQHRATNET